MATYDTTTVTLLRRPLGEADYLAVFLSRDRGKIRAKARGTRRPQSKLAALIQPFVLAEVQIATGKNLDVLTQGRVIETFRPLRDDLLKFAYASYMAQIADRAIQPDQPAPRFYDLLTSCFREAARQSDVRRVAMYFELQAVCLLGFEPYIEQCSACHTSLNAGAASWEPAAGGGLCPKCASSVPGAVPLSADASYALARLRVSRPSQLPQWKLSAAAQAELRPILRDYLLYHIECPLKTLDFLKSVEEAMPR